MRIKTFFVSFVVCYVFMHLGVLYACGENEPLWVPVARKLIENPDLEKNLESSDSCLKELSQQYYKKEQLSNDNCQFYFFEDGYHLQLHVNQNQEQRKEQYGVVFIKISTSHEITTFLEQKGFINSISNTLLIIDLKDLSLYDSDVSVECRNKHDKEIFDGRIFVIKNNTIMPLIKYFVDKVYTSGSALYSCCFSNMHYHHSIIISNILQNFYDNATNFSSEKLVRYCSFYAYVLKNQLCSQEDREKFIDFLEIVGNNESKIDNKKHIITQIHSNIFHFFLSHFFVDPLPLNNDCLMPYIELLQTLHNNCRKVIIRNFQNLGCFNFGWLNLDHFTIQVQNEQKMRVDRFLSFVNDYPQLYPFFNYVYEQNKDCLSTAPHVIGHAAIRQAYQLTQPRLSAKRIDYLFSERYKKYVRPYYSWINKVTLYSMLCSILWLSYQYKAKITSYIPESCRLTWNNLLDSLLVVTLIDDLAEIYKAMMTKKLIDLDRTTRIKIAKTLRKNPEWDFEMARQYLNETLKNKKT